MRRAALVCVLVFAAGCGKSEVAPQVGRELGATDTFRDGELYIRIQKVTNDYGVLNTTALHLIIQNRGGGKIHYLPLWDDRHAGARITDEHGNTFRPSGARYFRNPLSKDSPPANGNRVDPGAHDVLTIEFDQLPPSSRRLKVELPYGGSVVAFLDVPLR